MDDTERVEWNSLLRLLIFVNMRGLPRAEALR